MILCSTIVKGEKNCTIDHQIFDVKVAFGYGRNCRKEVILRFSSGTS